MGSLSSSLIPAGRLKKGLRRREGRIFVLRTGEGLVVKRAGKGTDGGWLLVSDHPGWPDTPWPDDATIIGEVRWMAREL